MDILKDFVTATLKVIIANLYFFIYFSRRNYIMLLTIIKFLVIIVLIQIIFRLKK